MANGYEDLKALTLKLCGGAAMEWCDSFLLSGDVNLIINVALQSRVSGAYRHDVQCAGARAKHSSRPKDFSLRSINTQWIKMEHHQKKILHRKERKKKCIKYCGMGDVICISYHVTDGPGESQYGLGLLPGPPLTAIIDPQWNLRHYCT